MTSSSPQELAEASLGWMADALLAQAAQQAVESGEYEWQRDPVVDNVIALTGPMGAVIIVYLEHADFEYDQDWFYRT